MPLEEPVQVVNVDLTTSWEFCEDDSDQPISTDEDLVAASVTLTLEF